MLIVKIFHSRYLEQIFSYLYDIMFYTKNIASNLYKNIVLYNHDSTLYSYPTLASTCKTMAQSSLESFTCTAKKHSLDFVNLRLSLSLEALHFS